MMGLLWYLVKCKLLRSTPELALYISTKQVDKLKKGWAIILNRDGVVYELEQIKGKDVVLYA